MNDGFLPGFLLGFVITATLMAGIFNYVDDYRRGQIDALTGRAIHYELREQENGERVWVKRESPVKAPAAAETEAP
jgi:hypothetical protein